MTIITQIEIEVEVDARVSPGSKDFFSKEFGNWLPGDPTELNGLRVLLRKSNQVIDITDALPSSVIDKLGGEILEEFHQENGDVA